MHPMSTKKLKINKEDLPIKEFEEVGGVFIEKNIHPNNDYLGICGNIKPIYSFFRYSPFEYLYRSFEDNTLYFSSPLKWDDPFEKQIFNLISNCTNESIYCISFNLYKNENEEAGWSLYATRSNATPVVRYSVQVKSLLDLLSEFKKKNPKAKFYLGLCDYSKDRVFLENLVKYLKSNCQLLCLKEKLSLMLLKRMSYKFENEIKLFILVPKNEEDHFIIKLKKYGFVMKDIIGSVTLPPLPIGSKLTNKEYTQLQKIINDGMMNYLQGRIGKNKSKVVNTGLYRIY